MCLLYILKILCLRQGGCIRLCLFVCLSNKDWMKFSENMGIRAMNRQFSFGGDPEHCVEFVLCQWLYIALAKVCALWVLFYWCVCMFLLYLLSKWRFWFIQLSGRANTTHQIICSSPEGEEQLDSFWANQTGRNTKNTTTSNLWANILNCPSCANFSDRSVSV